MQVLRNIICRHLQEKVLVCTAQGLYTCGVLDMVLNTKILKYSILSVDNKTLQHSLNVFIFRISDNASSDTQNCLQKKSDHNLETQGQKKHWNAS